MQIPDYSPLDFSTAGMFLNFSPQMSEFAGLGPAALSYNNMASVGMLPSVSENQRYLNNMMQNEAMRYSLRLYDRRPMALARMVGGTFGGNRGAVQAQAFMQQSPFLQNVASNFLDTSGMGGLFGGSPSDLGFGALAATSSGGMTMGRGYMPSRTQRVEAQRLAKHLYDSYYTESGFAKTDKIYGATTNQLSEIMAVGASSGAFRGMELSSYQKQFDNTIKRSFNANSLNEIKTFVEDSASLMRELTDIFGDRSFTELASIGQKITGLNIGGVGNARSMTKRIKQIKRDATALGMDTKEVLGDMMESAGILRQYGFSDTFSRQIASTVSLQDYQVYANQQKNFQRQGLGGEVMSFNTFARHHGIDTAAMINDKIGRVTTSLSILANRNLEGDTRNQVLNLIKSGDPNNIVRARQIYETETGMNINETVALAGGIQNLMNLSTEEERAAAANINSAIVRRRNRETRLNLYQRDKDISQQQALAMLDIAGEVGDDQTATFMRAVASGQKIDAKEFGVTSQIAKNLSNNLLAVFNNDVKAMQEAAKTHTTYAQIHATGLDSTALAMHGLGANRARKVMAARAMQNIDSFGLNLDELPLVGPGKSFLAGLLGDPGISNEKIAQILQLQENLNKPGGRAGSINMENFEIVAGLVANNEDIGDFLKIKQGQDLTSFLGKKGFVMQFKNEAGDVSARNITMMSALQLSDYLQTNKDGSMSLREDLTEAEQKIANNLLANAGKSKDISIENIKSIISGENRLEKLNKFASQARIGVTELDGISQLIVQQYTGEKGVNEYLNTVNKMRDMQKFDYDILGLIDEGLTIKSSGIDNSVKQKIGELINSGKSGREALELVGITDERLLKNADKIETIVKSRGESSWLAKVYRKNLRYLNTADWGDQSGKLGIGRQEELAVGDAISEILSGPSGNLQKLQSLMVKEGLSPTQAAERMAIDQGLEGLDANKFITNTLIDLRQQFSKGSNIKNILKDEERARLFVSSSLGEEVRDDLLRKSLISGVESSETREEAKELLKLFDQVKEKFTGSSETTSTDYLSVLNELIGPNKAINVNIVNDQSQR